MSLGFWIGEWTQCSRSFSQVRGFWAQCSPDKTGLGHTSLAAATAQFPWLEKGGPAPQRSGVTLAGRHCLAREYYGVGGGWSLRKSIGLRLAGVR